jgi:hypothetical protein
LLIILECLVHQHILTYLLIREQNLKLPTKEACLLDIVMSPKHIEYFFLVKEELYYVEMLFLMNLGFKMTSNTLGVKVQLDCDKIQ